MMRFYSRIFGVCTLLVFIGESIAAQEVAGQDSLGSRKPIDVVVSVGGGISKYMGDVRDHSERVTADIFGNRAVADLSVGFGLSKSFVLGVNALYGKLSGNENTFGGHRNFESQMVLAGVNVEYNFAGLYKGRLPVVNPFLVAGAYYSNYFNIGTDILYNESDPYFYWSDGTIRDLAESEDNRDIARNVGRDFDYETSLVDGSVHSFTASGGLGLDLHLSRAFAMRLMSRYFFAVTDNVDGFSSGSANGMGDGYFVNQLSLVVNTSAFIPSRRPDLNTYKYLFDPALLKEIEMEDGDADGVADVEDRCSHTPTGIKVDSEGCPLDEDEDGIADYLDIDPETPKGNLVTNKGVAVDYQLIEDRWVNAEGARIIAWDKKYSNPRYGEKSDYTVSFSVAKDKPLNETALLKKYPKLSRKELGDSLVVFNMGIYDKFESAANESLKVNSESEVEAYVIRQDYSEVVAGELSQLEIPDSVVNGHNYGVRESIEDIKGSKAYRSMALQMTVSKVEDQLIQNMPESMLVKQFLKGIAAYTWDSQIKDVYLAVDEELKLNPVQKYVMQESNSVSSGLNGSVVPTLNSELRDSTIQQQLIAEFKPSPRAKLDFMPTNQEFQIADLNGDGLISSEEIENVLNTIVEGRGLMEVEQFNLMTARYTDFTENVDPIDFGGTKAAYVNGVLTIFKPQNTEMKEDTRRLLAKKYKEADFDLNGELTPDEVQKMIAAFMEGDTTYSSEKIHELIDLYFE